MKLYDIKPGDYVLFRFNSSPTEFSSGFYLGIFEEMSDPYPGMRYDCIVRLIHDAPNLDRVWTKGEIGTFMYNHLIKVSDNKLIKLVTS